MSSLSAQMDEGIIFTHNIQKLGEQTKSFQNINVMPQ